MFISDLQIELEISKKDAVKVYKLLSHNSVNDALYELNNILLPYGIIAKKGLVKGIRKLFFYNPNKNNLAKDHENLFYVKYENSDQVLNLSDNNYSFIKNWDTFRRVEGYCSIL